MSEEVKKGSICVTETGDVVVVSRVDVQSEDADSQGRVHIFHVGTYLRSNTVPVGSRWAGQTVRVVCSSNDLLELAEDAGYDLQTRAEKPDSELTQLELLQKQVAQLQEALKQTAPQSTVVERPRTGIAALQPQK